MISLENLRLVAEHVRFPLLENSDESFKLALIATPLRALSMVLSSNSKQRTFFRVTEYAFVECRKSQIARPCEPPASARYDRVR